MTGSDEDRNDHICVHVSNGNFECKEFASITRTNKRENVLYTVK